MVTDRRERKGVFLLAWTHRAGRLSLSLSHTEASYHMFSTHRPKWTSSISQGPEAAIRISSLCIQILPRKAWRLLGNGHGVTSIVLALWLGLGVCGCGTDTETGTDNGVLFFHRFNHALSRLSRQCYLNRLPQRVKIGQRYYALLQPSRFHIIWVCKG